MNWLADNWIWLVLVGGFVALHLVGHRGGAGHGGGCCGGHGHKAREASHLKSTDGGCCEGGKKGKAPVQAESSPSEGKALPPGTGEDANFSARISHLN